VLHYSIGLKFILIYLLLNSSSVQEALQLAEPKRSGRNAFIFLFPVYPW